MPLAAGLLAAILLALGPTRAPEVVVVTAAPPPLAPDVGRPVLDATPCDGPAMADAIVSVAYDLTTQDIAYGVGPLSDCSGILHRLLTGLEDHCPGQTLPGVTDARSARALASWFAQDDRLVPMTSLDEADRWLVPGVIAFFGRPGRTELGRVDHVGVIVDVERDHDGQVVAYSMFHGRQRGLSAGITHWHRRDASPALGNGNDPLLAIAFPAPQLALAAPALGGEPVAAIADGWEDAPAEDTGR